jgi:spore cortex biosynthesis protein YabQ
MIYIQGMAEQTEIFFYSLGFGFLLGILYDVFRILRLIISRSKAFVLFMDLLYFAVCSLLIFCFMLVADSGKVRLYTAGGQLIGWLIYYFSLGTVAIRLTNGVTAFLRRIIRRIFGKVRKLFAKVWRKTGKMGSECKKIVRKSDKKVKFNLQKYRHIVYNLYGYIKKQNYSEKEKNDGC